MKILQIYLLAGLLAGTTATAAEAEDTIKKNFAVQAGGKLTIQADRGSIEIRVSDDPAVNVEVHREVTRGSRSAGEELLREHQVKFSHDQNNVMIKAELPAPVFKLWNTRGNNLKVSYLVTIPKKFQVDLSTAGGSITVNDLEGEVKCKTSGGSLKIGRTTGPVYARTSGGSIKLLGCKNKVDVETSGGSLQIGEVDGSVNARTSGGSIKISRANGAVVAETSGGGIEVEEVLGTLRASTSGGSITAKLSKQPEGACSLETSGGSINVYLAKDAAFDVDAGTSGGKVSTDFPVDGQVKKISVRGKLNGGGPALTLHTSGGNVHIRKL